MRAEYVKKKNHKLAFIAMPAILLAVATLSISTVITEDAFARNGMYTGGDASQAAAVNNDCLNPILDSNTIDNVVGVGNCGGTVSQQDESGQASAPLTHQTANPTIELQRATTSAQPGLGVTEDCQGCFELVDNNDEFLALIALNDGLTNLNSSPQSPNNMVTSIEELCDLLDRLDNDDRSTAFDAISES
ncbi:MAG: hypothetical protein ACRD8Z_09620, partial [Nitrososphaeraceae archaeon]